MEGIQRSDEAMTQVKPGSYGEVARYVAGFFPR